MTLRWKIAQYFELLWWRKYLRNKDKATYLTWKKNYWQTLLNKIETDVKMEPSKPAIDLGCGPAGIFIALPLKNITAVDPLLRQYETNTHFFKRSDYPNVDFVQSTIEDFDSARLKFNLVFCMNAINHVNDMERGFEKLKELCAENGTIIISIDAHNFSFFKHLFRLIPGDILHPHQYGLNEYKNFLERGGYKISNSLLLKQEFFFNHYLMVAGEANAVNH
jgi:2-polyprenyl-3-methyl-5-hydroxy-6-metoxy-1,4-benzoquinol methylase